MEAYGFMYLNNTVASSRKKAKNKYFKTHKDSKTFSQAVSGRTI